MKSNPFSTRSHDANAKALAYLRIAVGVLFLLFGEYKVFGMQFTLGGGFQGWIKRFIAGGAYPFMIPVLRGFVLPHGTVIAFLVEYGELAIGLALGAFALSGVGQVLTVRPWLSRLRHQTQ